LILRNQEKAVSRDSFSFVSDLCIEEKRENILSSFCGFGFREQGKT
jgi:hypothetical protein